MLARIIVDFEPFTSTFCNSWVRIESVPETFEKAEVVPNKKKKNVNKKFLNTVVTI